MSLCLEKPWASRPLFLGFFCFLFCREGQGDTGVGAQCVWCLQSGNSYCKDLWAHSKSRNVWQRCECLAPRQRFSGVRVEGMCNFGLRGRACVRACARVCLQISAVVTACWPRGAVDICWAEAQDATFKYPVGHSRALHKEARSLSLQTVAVPRREAYLCLNVSQ